MPRPAAAAPSEEHVPLRQKTPTAAPRRNNNEDVKISKPPGRQLLMWRIIALVFIIITVVLLIALIVVAVSSENHTETELAAVAELASVPDSCTKPEKLDGDTPAARRGNHLFSGLSAEETREVIDFMMASSDLDLVHSHDATLTSNYIYSVEDILPGKEDTLKYLDGTNRNPPVRKARVIVFMGSDQTVRDYVVYPIPSPRFRHEAFTNRPDGQKLTWQSRPICNIVEFPNVYRQITGMLEPAFNIMNASFQLMANECAETQSCIYFNSAPRVKMSRPTDRTLFVWFFVGFDRIEDYYMYPFPFYMMISAPQGSNEYRVQRIYYNNAIFETVDDLVQEYKNNPSIRYTMPDINKHRDKYGSPKYVKSGDTLDQKRRPPQQYYPDGSRFTVSGQHVEYLGWEFDIHTRTLASMQLFNIKYKKERIAYEISLQDILVIYSGGEPDDYFKSYFDNGWSTGRYNMPLVRGVDCPTDAIYLDSHIYAVSLDNSTVMEDAICVFEHKNSVPMRRHFSADFTQWGYRYAFSMPDSVLIVRQILTIWNYDYILDYEFHQNGIVEAKVSSTGYVAGTANVKDTKHGYVLNKDWDMTGNIHQHLFNFKMDIDVAGTKNRFKTLDMTTEKQTNNHYTGLGTPWYQMIMEETLITQESDAMIRYDFDKPKYYLFQNFYESMNGHARGYRIHTTGFSKNVLPDDSPLVKGGGCWSKYQLAVTKQNDNERTTASHFVQGDPFNPAVSFDRFLENNDLLLDQDLVAWVTVGIHHIPSSEDLPVTTTPGKTLSVAMVPFNNYERDPSIHSRDAAVFWNSEKFNMENQYLDLNGTCIPKFELPSIM